MKRITASAPNTRTPARAPAVRMPASTWAGSSPSCARCPSRTSTRKAPRARSGSPNATWRRSRLRVRLLHAARRRSAHWCARARAIGGWRNRPWARWTTAGWCPALAFGSFELRARTPSSRRPSWRPCARASCAWAELTAEFGAVSSPLKALERQGVVRVERRRRMRGFRVPAACLPAGRQAAFTPSPKPALTPGQAEALRVINEARAAARGDVVVVDGVTGSGKTEVYLQAIEATLAAGRTACVLVPEDLAHAPDRGALPRPFRRPGGRHAFAHGAGRALRPVGLHPQRPARAWSYAPAAPCSTPLRDVGLVVIDEEHEGS